MSDWQIVVEPHGKNVDEDEGNVGGMVVQLIGAGTKQEVSRVAFVRRNSKNPNVKFKDQLRAEVEKARTAAGLLNEQLRAKGELL